MTVDCGMTGPRALAPVPCKPPAVLAALWHGTARPSPQNPNDPAYGRALDVISTVINSVQHRGYPYRVGYGEAYGATDIAGRMVVVTSLPLVMRGLSDLEAFAIMTGIGLHESGHIRYLSDKMRDAAILAARGETWTRRLGEVVNMVSGLSNLLDDVRLERRLRVLFPSYASCFDLALWWVGCQGPAVRPSTHSATTRFNLAILATRYPRHTTWDHTVAADLTWWQEWALTYSADDTTTLHAAGVVLAAHRILDTPDLPMPKPPEPPEPPKPTRPKDDDDDDDDDEPVDEPGGDEPKPDDDDDDEPKPDDGGNPGGDDDEPKGDEPKDDPKGDPKGGQGGDDEPVDDDDEPVDERPLDDGKEEVPLHAPKGDLDSTLARNPWERGQRLSRSEVAVADEYGQTHTVFIRKGALR